MSIEKMYSLEQVSEILGMTKQSIYNYVKSGKLKAVKFGKYWRVSESTLGEFLKVGVPVINDNRRKENKLKKLDKKIKMDN